MKRGAFQLVVALIVIALLSILISSRGSASDENKVYLPAISRYPAPGDPIQITSIVALVDYQKINVPLTKVHFGNVYPVVIYAKDVWDIFSRAICVQVNQTWYVFRWELEDVNNTDIEKLTATEYRNVYIYTCKNGHCTVRNYFEE